MPNIGVWEIVIVVVIALLVFGPKKLPELGSSLGRSITGFKKGLRDNKEELATETEATNAAPGTTSAGAAATAVAATATPAATETPAKIEKE